MSRCKFASGKPFEGGSPCLKQTTARKKSRLLSRSLAFISIFCVLALLFTSLTPVVFADDMVPDVENQGGGDSEEPNDGNLEQPANPGKSVDSVDLVNSGDSVDPVDPGDSVDLVNSGDSVDPVDLGDSVDPENIVSDLNATLVIDEVVAGATEISGKIETEEAFPPYDLILEIIDNNGVKHTAELKADPDVPFFNPEWKIELQEDYPSLQLGDKITITIKDPKTDWMLSKSTEVQSTQSGDSELDISDVNIQVSVGGAAIKAPTIDPVFYDATTISGGNLAKARVKVNGKNQTVIATVHVSLKGKDGSVTELSVTPTEGTTWKVDLPQGKKVAEGDTVTVYQQIGEDKSPEVTATAQASKASTVTLKMPEGEIWIEQTSSNQVNADEQAEAIQMLKDANPDIANDFDLNSKKPKTKFSIDCASGTCHAYYEVTYTDGSTSGKVEAPDLKIKTVTEKSAAPTIQKVQVTDGQIIVTLEKEVAPGTKFYFVKNFTDGEDKNFCETGSCIVDKSTSQEMSQEVSINGTTVTFPIADKVNDLKLGREFGIVVKEPHKFRSCAKSEPVITTPQKVAVRDPHKLTDADKKAIDKAIRDANTVDGVSKLPDGTGFINDPAFIEFDKDGNVTIISPNDVEVDWDNDGNPVYQKNADGTYKLNDGAKVTKFPVKDLVKNLKPESPKIAVNTEDGKVTITPPAYEKAGDDTDLASYTITYKNASGAEQTVTATRDSDTNKWSGTGVDANTGVITLSVEDVELAGAIKATSKDNGGLEGDTNPLESDLASAMLETANVTYDPNQGSGTMEAKKLNKGSKYKILGNKFKAPDNNEFDTWEINGEKVTAGTEITVTKDTVVKAIWKVKEKEKVKVTYNANGGSGEMKEATVDKGRKYTLLESTFTAPDDTQEFKAWEVDGKEVSAGTEITVDKDTEVKALWKKIQVTVTYDANGGSGEMKPATVDKGSDYSVLPNAFTAPDDTQEFKAWEVDGQEVAPGDKITVKDTTVVKAVWKKIQVKVTYDANGGSGEMKGATVDKGSTYKLLASTFTAPENQEFKTWEIDGKEVAPGTEIIVNEDTTVKAIWKDIKVKVSYDANGGSGDMKGATLKKGSTYKLLTNAFTAPDETQEFDTWEIDGKKVAPGTEIVVTKDTVVKALWKKIQVKVTYIANGGSGTMEGKTLDKGSTYKLLTNAFTAPDETQEFDTWEIDGKKVAPGTEIVVTKDTVVKALWKKIQVKVTYNANGGSGTMDGKTMDKGSSYKLLANSFIAPENQEFDTWEVNGVKVAPGTEIVVTEDTVVKALWKKIQVKVTYNANGGSGTMEEKTLDKGSTYKLLENGFTAPANKEFKGWEVNNIEYAPGGDITVIADTIVKAVWQDKKIETFTVSYDGNGGTGTMEKETVKKDICFLLPDNGFTAPPGKEFKGWEVDEDGAVKTPGECIEVNKNITVKAIWKDKEVKVTYDPNGGSGTMDGKTLVVGSKYTLLESTFKAPDETQEFKAWEVGGKEVPAGTEITVDKDTEVKALWKKIQVNVTYDANGGSGTMEGKTLDKGSTYKLQANGFTAPENQEFRTWEIDGKEVAPGTEIIVNEDTTVKAIWKDIKVKVSYDANGGSGDMKGATLKKGSKYTLLTNDFTAPDETQKFKAWEVGGKEVPAGTEITVDKDTEVKALWKKIQVNVTYDANGGSGTMEGKTLDKGGTYKLSANAFTAPENQKFRTWEIDGKEVAPGTEIRINEDTTVKAIWKDIEVKVSYDANGGSGDMKGATLKKGSKYTLLSNEFTAPENKKFKGWEIDDTEYAVGAEITVNNDTTVKAIWKDIIVTITYDPNGGNWGGKTALVKKEYKKGEEIVIIEAPTRDGYKFLFWKGSEYQPGDKYKANADHTFTAQWKPSPDVPPVIGGINPRDIPPKYVVTPQGSMQSAPSPSAPRVYKTLPRTGESNGLPFLASALLALLGGALILSRKRS